MAALDVPKGSGKNFGILFSCKRNSLLFCFMLAFCVRDSSADYCSCGESCSYDWWSDDCYTCPAGKYTTLGGGDRSCETPASCSLCPAGKYQASSKQCGCDGW
jgi:hypothetical protein